MLIYFTSHAFHINLVKVKAYLAIIDASPLYTSNTLGQYRMRMYLRVKAHTLFNKKYSPVRILRRQDIICFFKQVIDQCP
ncbi:hypothetical protein TW86_21390 [Halomonas sp. S2151]|nr:hypothetical protein TW86_21390 [Halomonas sp. S2151]